LTNRISTTADFLLQLDVLKTVNRRNYINSGERLENSAEHSWHLAMACWAFAELLDDDFDKETIIKLALVHDLGEMDPGDTFLYSKDRSQAYIKERQCIERVNAHSGNPISNMVELWDEQEIGKSKEARLLKVVDRLLPFLLNMNSQGGPWPENGIHKSQVIDMHQFIEDEYPEIYQWFLANIDYAVEQGWLLS